MNLKYLIRMPAILISGILAGIIFLWLAFLIPDKLIYEHSAESVEIFTGEGLYPFVGNTPAEELDNWTDSLMLHTACYQKEDASALECAVAAYRPVYQDADPITSFRMDVKGIDDGMEITSYARYWHGYLVFLRPLLFFMDYRGIRALINLGVVFTLLLITGTLIRQKRYCLILPFLCTALFLRPLAIAFSIQFSSVYYVMIFSLFLILVCRNQMEQDGRYLYLFLINGMITAYLDLLTYPAAALGIPMVFFLATGKMVNFLEMCIFEYDDKREKELIRKAEYSEGMKEGERIGREAGKKEEAERIFKIYQLFRANYTENQIKEKLGMNVEEVRKILERFK